MNPRKILLKYYDENSPLFERLWTHSRLVMEKSLSIADNISLDINRRFVEDAALLHDIGIYLCHAPGIFCNGHRPYLCHGTEGARILRAEGEENLAKVAERHTGAGLTTDNIINQDLPLPHRDFIPQTIEEKLVCYADKFFSKSGDPTKEKNIDTIISQMKRFGNDSFDRFMEMHILFNSSIRKKI